MAQNYGGNILGLMGHVQQGFDQGRERGEQTLTRRLAGQTIGGDPAAFAQLSAINPAQAQAAQGAGDDQLRRIEGLLDYMDQAEKSGNPQYAQQAWQTHAVPYLRQFANGAEPTTNWAEAKPMLESVRAKIAMAKNAGAPTDAPTQFRSLDMQARAAGFQPGTPEYQHFMKVQGGIEGRAATGGFGFEKITGADGRERLARKNPRTGVVEVYNEATGDFEPLGGPGALNGQQAAPQPQQTPPLAGNGASYAATPTDETAQIEAEIGRPLTQDERATIASGGTLRFPPGSVPPVPASVPVANTAPQAAPAPAGAPPALGVSRSPEEQAAATTAAQEAAKTGALAEQERIKRESAVQQAGDIKRAEAGVAFDATQSQKSANANVALDLLDEAEKLLPQATGSVLGSAADAGAGFFGHATEGAKAIAALQTIAGQLTAKMPRMEGPQSNADVVLYKQMAGDLANSFLPVESRMAALREIRRLNQEYAEGGSKYTPPQGAGGQGAAPIRAKNPQTGEVIELRNGAWVPVQ